MIGRDADVEGQRLVALRAHFDPVRAGFDVQPLERAVELIDDADEIAVDIHFRFAWLDLQAQRAFIRIAATRALAVAWIGIAAKPRIVISAVVAAVITGAAQPPRVERIVAAAGDDRDAAAAGRRNRSARNRSADNRLVAVTRTRMGRNGCRAAVGCARLARAAVAVHGTPAGSGARVSARNRHRAAAA